MDTPGDKAKECPPSVNSAPTGAKRNPARPGTKKPVAVATGFSLTLEGQALLFVWFFAEVSQERPGEDKGQHRQHQDKAQRSQGSQRAQVGQRHAAHHAADHPNHAGASTTSTAAKAAGNSRLRIQVPMVTAIASQIKKTIFSPQLW